MIQSTRRAYLDTDHVGVLVGHDADPDLADDGAKMVAAGAAHRERPHDHELIEVLGIGKLGDRWLLDITALEHLVEVHLGHAARGGLGVVVALGVDDEAVEHALHLHLDLVKQLFQLARLDELGNVVVGVETFARRSDALADFHGNRRAFIRRKVRHIGVWLTGHGCILPVNARPIISRVLGR
jgi:hypothetical protein